MITQGKGIKWEKYSEIKESDRGDESHIKKGAARKVREDIKKVINEK